MLIDGGKNIFRAEKKNKVRFQHEIVDRSGAKYTSDTYQQVDDYLSKSHGHYVLIPEQEYVDVGYLTKVTNPFCGEDDKKTKIFIVAGIRGIGTWGVAECLKKNLKAIYNELGKTKDADFSAAIRIHYKNLDILKTTVIHVHKL